MQAGIEDAETPTSASWARNYPSTQDFEEEDDEYEHEIPAWDDPVSEEENDSFKDYTACDIECGYCGQCPY